MTSLSLRSLGPIAGAVLAGAAAAALIAMASPGPASAADKAASAPVKPALTVNAVQAERMTLPVRVPANGNVAAWQEASIGTEANGLRLAEVRVNVGDSVRRGQELATFAPDTVQADIAQIKAGVAEAEATLADAAANAARARELQTTGALSAQQINQYLTAERTAAARLEAQRALAKMQQLRLRQTRVVAPDDGVISARSATVGAVLPAGQELFRMIRKGRLEWRAELPSVDMARVRPGMKASITAAGAAPIQGRVRMLAPTVDPQTRNGLVYVDLPASSDVRAGMFARGEIDLGTSSALTLPQSAVLLREGFSYVLAVGPDSRLTQTKVAVGRRIGERVEILSGLGPSMRVVEAGGGFLGDGDVVRVVAAEAPAGASAK
jgi:RND family efflux transporter MFP subunit